MKSKIRKQRLKEKGKTVGEKARIDVYCVPDEKMRNREENKEERKNINKKQKRAKKMIQKSDRVYNIY